MGKSASATPTASQSGVTYTATLTGAKTVSQATHRTTTHTSTRSRTEKTSTYSPSRSDSRSASSSFSDTATESQTESVTKTFARRSSTATRSTRSMTATQATSTLSVPIPSFLHSENSTIIPTDSLLQKPYAARQNGTTGIRLVIRLIGDFFATAPKQAVVPVTLPNTCIFYRAFYVPIQQYFQQTPPEIALINQSAIALTFRFAELNTSAELRGLQTNDTISIGVNSSCHFEGTELKPLQFVFLPGTPHRPTPVPLVAEELKEAEKTTEITKIVAASSGAGMVAMQSSRSVVLLRMQACEPDFNSTLDRMTNPFQVGIGPYEYREYLSCALLNPILIVGLPALQALLGVIHSLWHHLPIRKGMIWVRFPSLAVLPLMYFIEPTCFGAVTVIIASKETWHTAVAVVSLVLCYALVFGMFVHLRRTWAAVMIPGVRPELTVRRKVISKPEEDVCKYEPWWRTKRRFVFESLSYWIDGGVSWKDQSPDNKGYCRSNRLLFMDFRGDWYWFLAVEMGVATMMGTLGGIQMEGSRCIEPTGAVIIILLGFLVAIAVLRPYNAPFLGIFSVGLTGLQLFAAVFTLGAIVGENERYLEFADGALVITFYLIVGRSIFDIAPKILLIGRTALQSIGMKIRRKEEEELAEFEENLVARDDPPDRGPGAINGGDERTPPLPNISFARSAASSGSKRSSRINASFVLARGPPILIRDEDEPPAIRYEWDPALLFEPVASTSSGSFGGRSTRSQRAAEHSLTELQRQLLLSRNEILQRQLQETKENEGRGDVAVAAHGDEDVSTIQEAKVVNPLGRLPVHSAAIPISDWDSTGAANEEDAPPVPLVPDQPNEEDRTRRSFRPSSVTGQEQRTTHFDTELL